MSASNIKAELANIDALIINIISSDSTDPILPCWEARRAEVADKLAAEEKAEADKKDALVSEALAAYSKQIARYTAFKAGQLVTLVIGLQRVSARVMDIAKNGVWIIRQATDGEFARGLDIGGQIKERVSIKNLIAA